VDTPCRLPGPSCRLGAGRRCWMVVSPPNTVASVDAEIGRHATERAPVVASGWAQVVMTGSRDQTASCMSSAELTELSHGAAGGAKPGDGPLAPRRPKCDGGRRVQAIAREFAGGRQDPELGSAAESSANVSKGRQAPWSARYLDLGLARRRGCTVEEW
jgi:hypothetical protein